MKSLHYPVLSLNLGKPQTLEYDGKKIKTGIMKQPADSAVMLHRENFEGDGQADLVNHGGPDKLSVSTRPSIIRFGKSFSQERCLAPHLVKI